jgi:hypothetical protein
MTMEEKEKENIKKIEIITQNQLENIYYGYSICIID